MADVTPGAPAGLSSATAAARLAEVGPNTVSGEAAEPVWHRLLRQFQSPLIYVLLFALAVDAAIWLTSDGHGTPVETVAIAVILLLNAGLGVTQEWRAEAALARLRELAAPRVWTFRDGRLVRLESSELVPGDVVRIEAGDRIPADAAIARAASLAVDESIMTGESLPIDKTTTDTVLAGTLAVRGTALLEITATGAASAMGRLAGMVAGMRTEPTPLERRLDVFGRRVAHVVLALAALIVVVGLAVEGVAHAGPVLFFAVALAVAAVPEGLPAVLTVTLALGVERMARRRAVVRRLAAVEALGSVTVVATDKTGTITANQMEVRDLDADDRAIALDAMVLANDAELDCTAGDPLDVGLLAFAAGCGHAADAVRGGFRRTSARPFDSDVKFARVTGEWRGAATSFVKGAPEVMLARCTLSREDRAAWTARIEAHAADGMRLLALAYGPGEREHDLTWLGVVLLWDPPRPEVADAVARARAAGVRVVMITGDHPATARAIAAAVGIDAAVTRTGADLDAMDDDALRAGTRETGVYARVTPAHKLRIVEALVADGEVVAMTGDGVNDAPALKRADVGIAMGQRGSDVSREVADLVLLDDDFATIVAAIEEGRGIYANVRKFVRFLFCTNLSELLVVTLGAAGAFAFGIRGTDGLLLLPLTAAQLLWINLATDSAPALALGLDRNPGVMGQPPRSRSAPLLDRPSIQFIVTTGIAQALVALALLGLLPVVLGESRDAARTATFLFLAFGQPLFAYPARRTSVVPARNGVLLGVVVAMALLQAAALAFPALRQAFHVVLPSAPGLVAVVVAIGLAWAVSEGAARRIWRAGC